MGPLAVPAPVDTVMMPVLPPEGASTDSEVALALETVAETPLNLTELPDAEGSKSEPLIVTTVLPGPAAGMIPEMDG